MEHILPHHHYVRRRTLQPTLVIKAYPRVSQNYPGRYLNFNENNLEDGQTHGVRRSSRQTKLPIKLNDYVLNSKVKYGIEKFVNYSNLKGLNLCFATTLNKSIEPSCLSDALSDRNWVDAMNNEIETLNRNNTWTECDLPHAILVAKGFSQKECFDYNETFSPVVKMVTVRCLVSIVVVNNWPLYQLNVNNAFLYGDLVEDVYMTLPEGYNSESKSKVCKLNKSLYGLKQTLRHWNTKLTIALLRMALNRANLSILCM
nr:putative reverse transcriptase, RNA-dependent DNA polymerase, Gag-polypeptide of LTR copia-type [Tanacetum cinerariifolium]